MKFEIKSIFLFALMSLFLLSLVSAQNTMIFGKVSKNTDANEGVGGVKITITCNGETISTSSSSGEDIGNYVVTFSDTSCPINQKVSVKAELGDWKGVDTAIVSECGNDQRCEGLVLEDAEGSEVPISSFALANPVMTYQKPSSSGGSNRGGSGGGSTIMKVNNTVKNVTVANVTIANTTNVISNDPIPIDEEKIEISPESNQGDGASITGAFVSDTKGSWLSMGIVLGALVLALVVLMIVRRSRKKPR